MASVHNVVFRVLRRCAGVGAAVLLLVTVTAWVAAHNRLDILDYRWGTLRESMPTPESPWAWSFDARTLSFSNTRAGVTAASVLYTSYGRTRDEMTSWSDWKGWRLTSANGGGASASGAGGSTFWNSWDDFGVAGIAVRKASRQGSDGRSITLPHWAAAGVLVMVTALLVRPDVRRWRRKRRGACLVCGYSRVGIAAAEPCPECGSQGSAVGHSA
jgi:hypothetical protein